MKPRCFLGLAFSLLATTSPLTAWAGEVPLPPLEGSASSPASPPAANPPPPAAQDPAAQDPTAQVPAATAAQPAPEASAPAEPPAATAPAPSEPPPPVHQVESDFPEPDAPGAAGTANDDGYTDELEPTAPAPETLATQARRRWEILLGLGIGNAFCDRDAPDSACPVAGGVAFFVGGGYRFVPNFSVGIEAAAWSYAVREGWQGTDDDSFDDDSFDDDSFDTDDDKAFSSAYLALYARWYWLEKGKIDPYLQAGIGLGSMVGTLDTGANDFEIRSSGWVVPVGIGVDWQLSRVFRLGPQALVYWHHATEICEKINGVEQCHDPGRNEDGNREGEALPWRIAVTGTFTLGSR